MDYREMTKKDMELQKKMIGEYSLRLAALPDGRLKGRSRAVAKMLKTEWIIAIPTGLMVSFTKEKWKTAFSE